VLAERRRGSGTVPSSLRREIDCVEHGVDPAGNAHAVEQAVADIHVVAADEATDFYASIVQHEPRPPVTRRDHGRERQAGGEQDPTRLLDRVEALGCGPRQIHAGDVVDDLLVTALDEVVARRTRRGRRGTAGLRRPVKRVDEYIDEEKTRSGCPRLRLEEGGTDAGHERVVERPEASDR
jgi:hypothetical protein